MKKVVKCNGCGQYFMRTEINIKCPFCHTEYSEVEEKAKNKKGTAKTRKEFFKVWKDK